MRDEETRLTSGEDPNKGTDPGAVFSPLVFINVSMNFFGNKKNQVYLGGGNKM